MRHLPLLLMLAGCDPSSAVADPDGSFQVGDAGSGAPDLFHPQDLDPATDLARVDDAPIHPLDFGPPADLARVDLRPACGVLGAACCASSSCNDGSFCSGGWCQTTCGLDGKPACDAAEGPCAKGLLEVGDQAAELGQQGWFCGKASQRCALAANCGYVGEACCAGGCYAGDGMNIPGGYCNKAGTCVSCSTPP